jgi:hypothetical protein
MSCHGPGFDLPSKRIEYQQSFWGVKEGQCVMLKSSPSFVSRMSRKCGNVDASETYGSHRPVTGIALALCNFDIGSQADMYEINFRANIGISGFPLSVMAVVLLKCGIMSLKPNQSLIFLCGALHRVPPLQS